MAAEVKEILIATRNAGKLDEIRQIFADLPVKVLGLDDLGDIPEIDEDGETFEANARHKALEAHHLTDLPTLADDSGLEVDALDGRPGVHSARYAPRSGNGYRAHIKKLLGELEGVPDARRHARFRCVVAFAHDGDVVAMAEGSVEGRIAPEPRGEGGFGYDPVFYVEDLGKTFAEVDREAKNERSHRGEAFRTILPLVRELLNL